MHLVGWLPAGADDRTASAAAATRAVEAAPLSAFRMRATGPGGLLLGYAGLAPREIEDGVERLAAALRTRTRAVAGV